MIIIVEGLDCSGKSTIADALADEYYLFRYREEKQFKNMVSFHSQLNEWTYFEAGAASYMLPMFKVFDNFVIDRFHVSSYAYARFFQRQEFIPFEKREDYLLSSKRDIIILYCDINEETFYRRNKEKNDRTWDFEPQKKLFEEALSISRLPVIKIDSNGCLENSLNQIREKINEHLSSVQSK